MCGWMTPQKPHIVGDAIELGGGEAGHALALGKTTVLVMTSVLKTVVRGARTCVV